MIARGQCVEKMIAFIGLPALLLCFALLILTVIQHHPQPPVPPPIVP